MTFTTYNYLKWIVYLDKEWDKIFNPSVSKKIRKSDEYFNSNFVIKYEVATEELFKNNFFDVYEKNIASKELFGFKKEEILNKYRKKIEEGNYIIVSLYLKSSGEFVGGVLIHIFDNYVSVALRAFDRGINKNYKARTTIDYWVESNIYKYFISEKKKYIVHGKDRNPYFGNIGLPGYKMQIGCSAYLSDDETKTTYDTKDITIYPFLSFNEADESGKYISAIIGVNSDEMKTSDGVRQAISLLERLDIKYEIVSTQENIASL